MNRFISTVCAALLVQAPSLLAQDAAPETQTSYKQKQFVFRIPDAPSNPAPDECDEGIAHIARYGLFAIAPNYSGKFPIYNVRTWNLTGKVEGGRTNQVGEILICQDWQTYWPEENRVPAYYEITLGGRKYRAVGGAMSTNFPDLGVLPGGLQAMLPEGYPQPGVSYLNTTATVLPAVEGKMGGIFYIGNLTQADDATGQDYDRSSVGVLQVLVPQPYIEPRALTYEYTGNFLSELQGNPDVFSTSDRVMARFTINCHLAHRAGDCKNLPYKDYLRSGAVERNSIVFTAGPATLPTADGQIKFQQFQFSTDADGRINSWDMDLYLDDPWINVDTDSWLDSTWFLDGGATVSGQPGTWRIIEGED